jgi:hypothetical protein
MPRKSKNTARRLAQAPKKPRSEPRVAKTAAQPKVRTSVLEPRVAKTAAQPKVRTSVLEPRVAKTASQPKVTTSTLSNTKGGRGDGTMEMVKRRLDPKSPQNRKKPTKSKSKKPRLK